MERFEFIKKRGKILAIIIYKDHQKDGINFFTPDDYSQQLAYMSHKKGKIIGAHTHQPVKRNIYFTQETLLIKKGKLKVNFYDSEQKYVDSRNLGAGDVVLLASGGHGFEVLEDVEIIEVKQGPYLNEDYKVRFKGKEGT